MSVTPDPSTLVAWRCMQKINSVVLRADSRLGRSRTFTTRFRNAANANVGQVKMTMLGDLQYTKPEGVSITHVWTIFKRDRLSRDRRHYAVKRNRQSTDPSLQQFSNETVFVVSRYNNAILFEVIVLKSRPHPRDIDTLPRG